MMSSNRALRSARDAVDAHHVWELDPSAIIDQRIADRLDPADVLDLRHAIETNGQTVPILVRRHPSESDRYLLVYGRRRLEAIRQSDKVTKVRALVASLDENAAMVAQISENMARRDLSFIEKALFAQELVETGFGTQSQVAEILTVTKSAISMAIAIADAVGADLIRAIGPAHGVGRPRWDGLAKAITTVAADRANLVDIARSVHARTVATAVIEDADALADDTSVRAFEAVVKAAGTAAAAVGPPAPARRRVSRLALAGNLAGSVRRSAKGVTIEIEDSGFADWLEAKAQDLMDELHLRWQQHSED
jgi:ParB family chromosome partitioning protein